VPTLELDGVRVTQSLAIIDYLDALHPSPRLIPLEPVARARAMEMALTIACDIHPLNNLRTLQYLETRFGQDRAGVGAWYAHWISLGFAALEALLGRSPAGPFAGGETPGLADICIAPQVFNARRYAVDLSAYPRIVEIADRAGALPAFSAAAPAIPSG
jgi:maleylacetoacetate isomerase/maleylpyruvate isomerase